MSASTSWMAESWSGVSSQAKEASNSRYISSGRRKGEPLADLAPGVDLQQFAGQLLDVLSGLALGLLPRTPPQFVQPRLAPLRPHIALHQSQAVHGQVELVAAGIFQEQEVAAYAGNADVLKSAVQGDAVVHVHHVVARLELGQGGQDLLLAHLGDASPPDPFAEQLLFGDQGQAGGGQAETAGDLPKDQGHMGRGRCAADGFGEGGFADEAGDAVGGEQLL